MDLYYDVSFKFLFTFDIRRSRTFDGFELHMGVNYIGHFLLVNLLLPDMKNVKPEARIVIVRFSFFLLFYKIY